MENIKNPHRILKLPAFFLDATKAVIRSLDSSDIEECVIEGLVECPP